MTDQPEYPNGSRVYDYFLDGTHHFPVDAEAGAWAVNMAPFIPTLIQLQHNCLSRVARELTFDRGYDIIVDFASGLPTKGNLHNHVKEGTTVIYSDINDETIAYAKEILGDTPNVHYFKSDVKDTQALLNSDEVQAILQGRKDIAITMWGITLYQDDETVKKISQDLYGWAGEDTTWVMNFPLAGVNDENEAMQRFYALYDQMNEPLYSRPLEQCAGLVSPWQEDGDGFTSILKMNEMTTDDLEPDVFDAVGEGGGSYGSFLKK